jgi:hypothetical protein
MSERHFFEGLAAVTPRRDPAWEEAKLRLWAMTPDERRAAMYAGTLNLRLCLHWANHARHEVPELNGELWFIAIHTPEVADAEPAATTPNAGKQSCRR